MHASEPCGLCTAVYPGECMSVIPCPARPVAGLRMIPEHVTAERLSLPGFHHGRILPFDNREER